MTMPNLRRGLAYGSGMALPFAAAWAVAAAVLDLGAGLVLVAAIAGWLIGTGAGLGAGPGKVRRTRGTRPPRPPPPSPPPPRPPAPAARPRGGAPPRLLRLAGRPLGSRLDHLLGHPGRRQLLGQQAEEALRRGGFPIERAPCPQQALAAGVREDVGAPERVRDELDALVGALERVERVLHEPGADRLRRA